MNAVGSIVFVFANSLKKDVMTIDSSEPRCLGSVKLLEFDNVLDHFFNSEITFLIRVCTFCLCNNFLIFVHPNVVKCNPIIVNRAPKAVLPSDQQNHYAA